MPIFSLSTLRPIKNGWDAFSDLVSNKLTEATERFLEKYTGADLYIVAGPAGAGKSSLIKLITGEDVYVGSTLKSGTTTTSLVPAIIEGKRSLFLDTPGFHTPDFDEWDIFYRIVTAMAVVQRYVKFRGVLYVDSMKDNRITAASERILTWLSLFCGQDFMPNVTIVTTMWDGLDADGIEDKMSRVEKWTESNLLQRFISHGARIYHHGLIMEDGNYKTLHIVKQEEKRRSLVRGEIAARYRDPTVLKLLIFIEIANGATIDMTLAGRCLKHRHTAGDSQGNEEPNAESSTGSHSASEEQAVSHQERAQTHDHAEIQASSQNNGQPDCSGEADLGSTWGAKFIDAWEDISPWIRLLIKAGKVYMSATSASTPPQFNFPGDEYIFTRFEEEEDTGPGFGFSPPTETSWPDCVVC